MSDKRASSDRRAKDRSLARALRTRKRSPRKPAFIPQGDLQYLVKARDKFLAHPMFGGRVRNAHGAMSIPQNGILHPHAPYADETDPVLLDYYGSSFAPKSAADEARFRVENEKLLLSPKKNDKFPRTRSCA
jgi:hypothetical protein